MLLYEYSIFILHVVQLYQLVYIRWEPGKLSELVFKPFVYVMHIYKKICSNQYTERYHKCMAGHHKYKI